MRILILLIALSIMIFLAYTINSAWQQTAQTQFKDTSTEVIQKVTSFNAEQIQPLPLETKFPTSKVNLGKRLFNDPQLSRDKSISCASCHNLTTDGTDDRSTSLGIEGRTGEANAPTVFNSGFNFSQFWDGRAATLEEQAVGPIHNPVEMDADWKLILPRLLADKKYQYDFNKIYTDGLTAENIVDAIATFERNLTTPNSKFDRYLRGDKDALNKQQLEGYQRFKDYGCISCHQGINIGGNMFQRIGILQEYFKGKVKKTIDMGRFNITGREEDKHVFKVPGLRNVAVTGPYLHDGSITELSEVIQIMGKYQLGRILSDEDTLLILAFLSSLTGEWQGKLLQ